jgi:hypothetical protein
MMQRCLGLTSAFVLIATSFFAGCSSAETPSTGTGGSTTGSGGATASGGASVAQGGSVTGSGGTTGTGTGGSTSTAGTCTNPPDNPDPACKSISSNMACSPTGTMCPDKLCGIADTGIRSCSCTDGLWKCVPCSFECSPFKNPPATVPACAGQTKGATCQASERGNVCSESATRICACWEDDEGALIWDCDSRPSSWPAP